LLEQAARGSSVPKFMVLEHPQFQPKWIPAYVYPLLLHERRHSSVVIAEALLVKGLCSKKVALLEKQPVYPSMVSTAADAPVLAISTMLIRAPLPHHCSLSPKQRMSQPGIGCGYDSDVESRLWPQ
jgi:hypothetical protein